MRVYLAGPMRGYEDHNFPAFHFAAAKLREQGFEVFSPAEKGEELRLKKDPSIQHDLAFRRKVFQLDLSWICENSDAVALLPGWDASEGALAERQAARAVGLTIIELGQEYVQ
jgi:nucleoside 2-deoxyribosyltransferase